MEEVKKQVTAIARVGLVLAIMLSWGTVAVAKTADTETLLINKLTKVFLKLPDGNATKAKMTLRLADLHAERARLLSKEELEKGCVDCHAGEGDRKKALEYYQYALPSLKGDSRQRVMVQVGHLYELQGQNSKAISFYKDVISQASGKGLAEAHFSLAEIYFKQRDFVAARPHYQKALQADSFPRKGLASFRLAWCQYNSGQINQAVNGLETILTTDKLLSRGGEGLTSVDQDFKAEVAKDYTVFLAHSSQIGMSGIEKVYKYSPNNSRIENVSFLAKELERLGQIDQAQKAWEMVVSKTDKPEVRMEALVYLAGLQMKNENKEKILPYLKRAFRNWASLEQCKDQRQCDELKKRIRRLVFDWNRSEKKNPSQALLEGYQGYFSVEKQDQEAFVLASQAAMLAKNYDLAKQWNQKALTLSTEKDQKETLLIRQLEIAELAKNESWLMAAQTQYLKESPKQSKASEIRYQMAQAQYDKKNYQAASEQFRSIAISSTAPTKLKEQAAEMSLDALVLLKDDQKIESWSREYAGQFPKQRAHFMKLAGQSVLSQSAALAASGVASDSQAWQTLNRFDVAAADAEKKKTYYKNKIILARKLKKFHEMDQSLRAYMGLNNLSADEKKFALENKVWLAELQLNFAEAYASYKKLETKDWLELARLADLAEKPSQKYYINYLKKAEDPELAFSICAKLVKESKKITGPNQICVKTLKTKPDFFAGLIMELYSTQSSSQLLKKMQNYGLEKTAVAHVLKRDLLIAEGDKQIARLNSHKLDGRSHRVAGSIKTRLNRITQFERTIQKATGTGDWLTQVYFLTELEKQYGRFYQDLLALPTPKDLTPEEQQQYLSLLSQQAAPYKEKSEQIQFKLGQLWETKGAVDQLFADFHKSPIPVQKKLGPQIEKLIAISPQDKASLLALVYRKPHQKNSPSLASLEVARAEVKRSPLDRAALQRLIQLEKARGYKPMVIYLNSRLKMVDQGFENKTRSL